MGKKRKFEVEQKDTNEFGLPAKFLATSHIRSQEKRLIVILEGAQLETVKVSQLIWTHTQNGMFTFLVFVYRLGTRSNYWIVMIISILCDEITKIPVRFGQILHINRCSCYSIRRWIVPVYYKCTFIQTKMSSSKSIHRLEFHVLSNDSGV